MHSSYIKALSVAPNSPQAASLGSYGEYPVSLFTGAIDISVPITSIGGTRVSLPVTLNYNSSGVRVISVPSWVGSGWDLTAGGVITRQVEGSVDLKANYFDRGADITRLTNSTYDNYYFDRHKLFLEALNQLGDGRRRLDTQPDRYSFTHPGGAGAFYLLPNAMTDPANGVLLKRVEDISIVPTFEADGEIASFLVTDGSGTRYHYTAYETTTTTLEEDYPGTSYMPAYRSAWYLTLVESYDLVEKIVLVYDTDAAPFHMPVNTHDGDGVSVPLPNSSSQSGNACGAASNVASFCGYGPTNIYGGTASVTIANQRKLRQINYSYAGVLDTRLDFVRSAYTGLNNAGAQKLDQITISKGPAATAVRVFKLTYAAARTRLTLEKVQEFSADLSVAKPATRFEYHATQLPAYTSNAVDFWGYYNGATTNTALVPSISCNGAYYGGADRNASTHTLAGGLQRVVYPTGGYTEFVFEPHRVAPVQACPGTPSTAFETVGGMRIKEVRSYSAPGQLAFTKSYTYTLENSTLSSGTLLAL